MNAVKHSGCCGVSARRLAVALSASSPRADYRAVGFPLQSLTRNAVLALALCLVTHVVPAQFFKPYDFMTREVIRDKKVKCISVYTEKDTGRAKNQELCFDQNGKLLQVLTFWGNPVQADSELYVYDSNGNELEYTRISSISNDVSATGEPILQRVTIRYASQYDHGRLVRYVGNDGAYLMSGSNYTELRYDTLGRVIERAYHDTIKHETQRSVSVYDKTGKEILELNYDEHI
jgi:hypothetical protein